MAELRSPQIRRAEGDFVRPECSEMRAKTKDPSGGTTGRVKLYGRLGGWALAPNTASMGRDNRSHIYWAGGGVGFARGRLFGRHGGSGLIQRPGPGNVLPVRNIFSSRPVRNRGDRHRWRGRDGRDRRKGIRLSPAEQIVATGGAEIAGRFQQDLAHLAP